MRHVARMELVEAAKDYKYLLNRGFPQKASLDLVSSRYSLSPSERSLLLRCVHRDSDVEVIKRKVVSSVDNEAIVVDGYNVFLTVASAIDGMPVYLCDDGFVRDVRSSYRKGFVDPSVEKAVGYVVEAIELLRTKEVLVVLDKNVSWSSRHAEMLKRGYGIPAVTAAKADITLIGLGRVVCSSDFVILSRSERAFDLAQFVLRNLLRDINIIEVFKRL